MNYLHRLVRRAQGNVGLAGMKPAAQSWVDYADPFDTSVFMPPDYPSETASTERPAKATEPDFYSAEMPPLNQTSDLEGKGEGVSTLHRDSADKLSTAPDSFPGRKTSRQPVKLNKTPESLPHTAEEKVLADSSDSEKEKKKGNEKKKTLTPEEAVEFHRQTTTIIGRQGRGERLNVSEIQGDQTSAHAQADSHSGDPVVGKPELLIEPSSTLTHDDETRVRRNIDKTLSAQEVETTPAVLISPLAPPIPAAKRVGAQKESEPALTIGRLIVEVIPEAENKPEYQSVRPVARQKSRSRSVGNNSSKLAKMTFGLGQI